jgi:3-hydroxyacyl-CoA dehydrogenase
MHADYQLHGDVALITLNNPPVNGLGYATRVALMDALAKAQATWVPSPSCRARR